MSHVFNAGRHTLTNRDKVSPQGPKNRQFGVTILNYRLGLCFPVNQRARTRVAEQKIKMTLPDGKTIVDGVSVSVKRSIEQWSEFELEDGSKFKGKLSVATVHRSIDVYDPAGIPWYQIQIIPLLTPMEVPDELKEKKEE